MEPGVCLSGLFLELELQGGYAQGVQNVYTQHVPLLVTTLESLVKGRLKEADFPFVRSSHSAGPTKPPKLVVVFVVGGTTYEEARNVAELNAQAERNDGSWTQGVKFILGGTGVQNSASFLKDVAEMAASAKFH